MRPLPSAERLRELLSYDPATGELRWRARGKGRPTNRPAGCREPRGYRLLSIDYRLLKAHRVIWCIVHGYWPAECLDHINGDPSDNRLCNLREATLSQNRANSRGCSDSILGIKGVTPSQNRKKYIAQIKAGGVMRHIGTFDTPEAAHAAYMAAANEHFGEFARAA